MTKETFPPRAGQNAKRREGLRPFPPYNIAEPLYPRIGNRCPAPPRSTCPIRKKTDFQGLEATIFPPFRFHPLRAPPVRFLLQSVQRALTALSEALQYMCVDHRCRNVGVPQQLLHRPDICPVLQHMRRETMAQRMASCPFRNLRPFRSRLYRLLRLVFAYLCATWRALCLKNLFSDQQDQLMAVA